MRPVSLRCSEIIMSVTDSKTNWMLFVSVAQVTWVYTVFLAGFRLRLTNLSRR